MLSLALIAAAMTPRPAAAHPATPWGLGRLALSGGAVTDCPAGFVCHRWRMDSCPSVQADIRGSFAWIRPTGTPRGVVIFIDGGGGTEWWANPGSGEDFLKHLRDGDGFMVVELRFSLGWNVSSPREQTGPAHVACRPATAIDWIYRNVYLPLHLTPATGECGFCVSGNSGGASATVYPLAYYGLDTEVNAFVPTGGPDHAGITKACLMEPGYEYNANHRKTMDYSYGWENPAVNPGPCLQSDPTWATTWDAASLDIGGNDYDHPLTRVAFVIGGLDDTGAPAHAQLYCQKLLQDPANHVTWTFIPDMPHHIEDNPEGQAAIEADLLGSIAADGRGASTTDCPIGVA